jgi:hypothetical protein
LFGYYCDIECVVSQSMKLGEATEQKSPSLTS